MKILYTSFRIKNIYCKNNFSRNHNERINQIFSKNIL